MLDTTTAHNIFQDIHYREKLIYFTSPDQWVHDENGNKGVLGKMYDTSTSFDGIFISTTDTFIVLPKHKIFDNSSEREVMAQRLLPFMYTRFEIDYMSLEFTHRLCLLFLASDVERDLLNLLNFVVPFVIKQSHLPHNQFATRVQYIAYPDL